MSKSFVQVPPQSTGKKISTELRREIYFDNLTGAFEIGNIVVGGTSGASGKIVGIQTEGFAVDAGILYLSDFSGNFQDNETLEVATVSQALVNFSGSNSENDFDLQKVIITDPNNLNYNQRIDRFGATLNTFTDGSPNFGPFGTMSVGEPVPCKDWTFLYDIREEDFWDQTASGGTVTHEVNTACALLTTTTATSSLAQRTSHYHQQYFAGIGGLFEFTTQLGDTGKTNLVRRWGQYDDYNGFFFELSGTTLSVNIRSSSADGSTVVDTKISQDNFNVDQLDGSDSINFSLDVTKGNIYWLDYQWLGAGRVRFGVVEPGGSRLVAHVFENANTNAVYPYTRTANLPVRCEQFNIGTTVSTSQMRVACASIKYVSKINPYMVNHTMNSGYKNITTAGGEVPILALRPKTTFKGEINRLISIGKSVGLTNVGTGAGGGSGNGGPVLFRVRTCTDAALTGETFTSHDTNSVIEHDTSATAINTSLAHEVFSVLLPANSHDLIQTKYDPEGHEYEFFLQADGVTQPIFVITAECLSGTDANVMATINWGERR